MGLAFSIFLAVMIILGSINKSDINIFSNMDNPIIVIKVINQAYIIEDSVGTIVLADTDKKKWEFLKYFDEGDTIKFEIAHEKRRKRERLSEN